MADLLTGEEHEEFPNKIPVFDPNTRHGQIEQDRRRPMADLLRFQPEAKPTPFGNNLREIGILLKEGILRESAIANLGELAALAFIDAGDEGFDPYFGSYLEGYERHRNAFINVRNRAYGDYLKMQIDEGQDRLDLLEAGGGIGFVSQVIGAGLDISSMLPLAKVKTLVGAVGVEEAIRQAAQPTRTGAESFMTVGASALIAGLVRAAHGGVPDKFKKIPDVHFTEGGPDGPLLIESRLRITDRRRDRTSTMEDVLGDIRRAEEDQAAGAMLPVDRIAFFERQNSEIRARYHQKRLIRPEDAIQIERNEVGIVEAKRQIDEEIEIIERAVDDPNSILPKRDVAGEGREPDVGQATFNFQADLESDIAREIRRLGISGASALIGFSSRDIKKLSLIIFDTSLPKEARITAAEELSGIIQSDSVVPAFVTKERIAEVLKDLKNIVRGEQIHTGDVGSVGAQAAPGVKRVMLDEQFRRETMLPAGILAKLPDAPFKRVLMSDNLLAREVAQMLVDNPFFMEKHRLGIATPQSVESDMRRHWWPTVEAIVETNRQYDLYRGGIGSTKLRDSARRAMSDVMRGTDGAMTHAEFKTEVAKALHNGDRHAIPEVQASAQAHRKVYENFRQQLMDEEVFVKPIQKRIRMIDERLANERSPRVRSVLESERAAMQQDIESLETVGPQPVMAESYGVIIWRADLIKSEKGAFQAKLRDHFSRRGLSGKQLEEAVNETTETILRDRPFKKLDEDEIGSARSLKQRTLDIDPNDFFEFMELDSEALIRYYTRTISADLELTKKFGSIEMSDQITQIKIEYDALIDASKNKKEMLSWTTERNMVLRDIRAMRDRTRGTYGLPDDPYRMYSRIVHSIKQIQYTTMLGGVVISSIPDLARLMMVEGLERSFKDAFVPLIKNLDGLRIATKEGKMAGVAVEMEMGFRAHALADVGDVFGRHSRFERGLQKGSDIFSMLNIFNPWNAAMKGMASSMVGARIIEDSILSSVPFRRSLEARIVKVKPHSMRTRKGVVLDEDDLARRMDLDRDMAEVDFDIQVAQGELDLFNASGADIEGIAPFVERMDGLTAKREALIQELSDLESRPVGARNNRKTNTIFIDEVELDEAYARGNWHTGTKGGVDALPEGLIRNRKDFGEFVMHHELAHSDYVQLPDELFVPYENRINRVAANRMFLKRYNRATKKSKFGREKLLRAGIDDAMADRIAKQWEQEGFFNEELLIAGTENWNDLQAMDVFRNALGQDVDRIIVTPGPGDTSLWVSTELGSMIGQFKSFSMTSVQKVMLPGIQQRDSLVGMGVVMMVALGIVVDSLKRDQYDIPGDPSLTERLFAGVDRSGIAGYFSDINRIIETVTNNQLGVSSMLGIAHPYQPSFRNKAGAILGPTAGQGLLMLDIMSDVLSGNADYHTAGALRRIVPGNNIFWMDPFFDTIQQGVRF